MTPAGTLDSWMSDYLARIPIVVCLACGWWQQYRRPNPSDPRSVSNRPRWCPECAIAAITVTDEGVSRG